MRISTFVRVCAAAAHTENRLRRHSPTALTMKKTQTPAWTMPTTIHAHSASRKKRDRTQRKMSWFLFEAKSWHCSLLQPLRKARRTCAAQMVRGLRTPLNYCKKHEEFRSLQITLANIIYVYIYIFRCNRARRKPLKQRPWQCNHGAGLRAREAYTGQLFVSLH